MSANGMLGSRAVDDRPLRIVHRATGPAARRNRPDSAGRGYPGSDDAGRGAPNPEHAHVSNRPANVRRPVYVRMRARVPGVLYLNFLADYEYAARLAPESFRPDLMTTRAGKTLFTILLFQLREGRPVRAPAVLGRFAPDLWQSNWRFYGTLTRLPEGARPGVLFWLTVTDSRCLNLFGRRIGRCFPVRRAHRMEVRREGDELRAFVDPGNGTAPHLSFRGRLTG